MGRIAEIPSSQEVAQAKESSRRLYKYAQQDRVTMTITGLEGVKEDVVLPGHVMDMLLQILTEISKGKAISIMPIGQELTTQEVANLLNVSRPHVIKLLESEQIPFHKVGSHRRVYLKDLVEFMNKNQKDRAQALDELAELSQSLGMY